MGCFDAEIIACKRCPRLIAHCARVAQVKRRAYMDCEYWGRPVPSTGDVRARLLIVGLAPGAHGSNRTGRMFMGDRSGEYLFRALDAAGLDPRDVYITAAAHCAPPDNKPTREELAACRPYLEREIDLLKDVKVVVALGKIAFDTYLSILKDRGLIASRAAFRFGHNVEHGTGPGQPALISSYHPSQQNTSTGRLTDAMLRDVFARPGEV